MPAVRAARGGALHRRHHEARRHAGPVGPAAARARARARDRDSLFNFINTRRLPVVLTNRHSIREKNRNPPP
jgi:hypothetical protein